MRKRYLCTFYLTVILSAYLIGRIFIYTWLGIVDTSSLCVYLIPIFSILIVLQYVENIMINLPATFAVIFLLPVVFLRCTSFDKNETTLETNDVFRIAVYMTISIGLIHTLLILASVFIQKNKVTVAPPPRIVAAVNNVLRVDERLITVDVEDVCAICLDQTLTTLECGHKLCQECAVTLVIREMTSKGVTLIGDQIHHSYVNDENDDDQHFLKCPICRAQIHLEI